MMFLKLTSPILLQFLSDSLELGLKFNVIAWSMKVHKGFAIAILFAINIFIQKFQDKNDFFFQTSTIFTKANIFKKSYVLP